MHHHYKRLRGIKSWCEQAKHYFGWHSRSNSFSLSRVLLRVFQQTFKDLNPSHLLNDNPGYNLYLYNIFLWHSLKIIHFWFKPVFWYFWLLYKPSVSIYFFDGGSFHGRFSIRVLCNCLTVLFSFSDIKCISCGTINCIDSWMYIEYR